MGGWAPPRSGGGGRQWPARAHRLAFRFFAIFIYFRIFVFACEQHKHPHIKVRFSRVGAPLTWKSYDFRRHFRQMDRRLTVKMSFGRMKE